MPPILVIVALIAGYTLAGFLGALLSVPVAAVVLEIITDFDKRKRRIDTQKRLNLQKSALYLTTTLPYVNADPHIGFALEFVQADVVRARWAFARRRGFFQYRH